MTQRLHYTLKSISSIVILIATVSFTLTSHAHVDGTVHGDHGISALGVVLLVGAVSVFGWLTVNRKT